MNKRSKSKNRHLQIARSKIDLLKIVKRIDFDEDPLTDKEKRNFAPPDTLPAVQSRIPVEASMNDASNVTRNTESTNFNLENTISSNLVNIGNTDFYNKESPSHNRHETNVHANNSFSEAAGTRETITSDYFSGTDTPSKLKESTKRLRTQKQFNNYIAYSSDEELEDWWQQPKTDYTYSASLSYRERVTPERRIGSPNMSRKGLRGELGDPLMSPPFSRLELPSNASDSLSLRSRKVPRGGLSAFSDDSDIEESQSVKSSQSYLVKENKSVSSSVRSFNDSRSVLLNASNNLRYGLDLDSDTDEGSPMTEFARPIVRKGLTSLLRRSATPTITNQSNSINGRMNNSRMANHIRTTSVTTVTESSETDGGRYRLGFGLGHEVQQNEWKVTFRKSSQYLYSKFINIFSIISYHTILWCTHLYSSVRNSFSHASLKSRSQILKTRNNADARLITTTITTTTVLSRKQIIYKYFEDALGWYEKKRTKSPFMCGWLPLLLLFLIPFLVYLIRVNDEGKSESSENLLYSLSDSSSWFGSASSFLSQKISILFTFFSNMSSGLLSYLKYLMKLLYDFAISIFIWVYNGLSFVFSILLGPTHLSSSANQENSVPAETNSLWSLFSSGLSHTVEGIRYAGNSVWLFLLDAGALLLNGFLLLWNWILLCFQLVWSFISSSFIGIFKHTSNLMSEIFRYSYKMLIPFMSKTTKGSILKSNMKLPSIAPSPSHSTSEELVQQILLSPVLQNLISVSVQEHETNIKERFDSIIKENVEAEINKLKNEFILSKMHSEEFSTSKMDISALKIQQEIFIKQFFELENMLKGIIGHQENFQASSESIEQLQKSLSIISANIQRLNEDIENLKSNQVILEKDLRSCCRNTSVTLEQVGDHVRLLLSDLIGFESSENDGDNFSSKLRDWMSVYFVAKDDMEEKLNNVLERVTANTQNDLNLSIHEETVKQTSEQVMSTVLEKIRAEIMNDYKQMKDDIMKIDSSTTTAFGQLNENFEKYKSTVEDYRNEGNAEILKMKTSIDDTVLESIESRMHQLIDSSEQIDPSLHAKLYAALRPLIAETVERKLTDDLDTIIDQKVVELFTQYIQNSEVKLSQGNTWNMNISQVLNASDVQRIVKAALLKYDADKTGMVDHALESGGGSIVSTRCTEGYQGHQAELTIFGYSFYRYSTNTPRSIIQPDRNPGQCYAFKGSQGFIVIQFAGPVRVSAFTIEHIPKILTPSGSIDSAPKEFSVFGLQTTSEEGFNFGTFTYDDQGEPLQYFPVQHFSDDYFNYVELKVLSNHGNMQYTCLYRFRVHGVREPFSW